MYNKKVISIIAVILCVSTLISLSACSKKSSQPKKEETKSIEDFSFNDMQGMNTWVLVYNTDFDNGTLKLIPSNHINGFVAITFEDGYYYEQYISIEGTLYPGKDNARAFEILSDEAISIDGSSLTKLLSTRYDLDNNYLEINFDGTTYVPFDMIDWSSLTATPNSYSGSYNFICNFK